MRPLKMTMSTFMSYGGVQEIDFTKLGYNGLYLITGETGAGKTTIFDAIMFALYGKASGDLRTDGSLFRSKYADIYAETYVELYFECNGRKYRVKRNPEYTRVKKSGEGTTTQNSDAELESLDGGPLIRNVTEVTNAIEKIIGLTKAQFSQIAMIAQGQFRELLTVDTNKRRDIFRHIFETGNFDKLQTRIKDDNSALNTEINGLCGYIRQDIEGIQSSGDENEFSPDIAMDPDFIDEKVINPLNSLVSNDLETEKSMDEVQKKLAEKKSEITKNIEKAKSLENTIAEKNKKDTLYAAGKKALEEATNELTEAKMSEGKIEELKKNAAVESEKIKEYDALDIMLSEKDDTAKKQAEKSEQQTRLKTKCDEGEKRIKLLKEELEGLKDVDLQLQTARTKLAELDKDLKDTQEVEQRFAILVHKRENLEKLLRDVDAKNKKKDELTAKADKLSEDFLLMQAGLMAADLVEGQKCPVCGSEHHPYKAEIPSDKKKVTREEVDNARKVATDAANACTDAVSKLGAAKSDKESYEEETVTQAKKYVKGDTAAVLEKELKAHKTTLQRNVDSTNENIHTLEGKLERKNKLQLEIPQLETQKEENANSFNQCVIDLSALNERLQQISAQITSAREKLQFATKTEAVNHVEKIESEAKELQLKIDVASEKKNKLNSDCDKLLGEIGQLKQVIDSSEKMDLEKLQQELGTVNSEIDSANKDSKIIRSRLDSNQKLLERLRKRKGELATLLKKKEWMSGLFDTVTGKKTDDNGRIMLETYVQQAYFMLIVKKANIRFEKMTEGHFSLSVVKEIAKDRQSGLDLEVIDHYNDSRRTVKSLSGGEQFEASLSLALGLSDMVQEMSAGVKLDCMFVDEGFGSLDDDTLNRALIALRDLGNGNRLVGIISHVNEIQKEIDKKIYVRKDARGFSKAEILV